MISNNNQILSHKLLHQSTHDLHRYLSKLLDRLSCIIDGLHQAITLGAQHNSKHKHYHSQYTQYHHRERSNMIHNSPKFHDFKYDWNKQLLPL